MSKTSFDTVSSRSGWLTGILSKQDSNRRSRMKRSIGKISWGPCNSHCRIYSGKAKGPRRVPYAKYEKWGSWQFVKAATNNFSLGGLLSEWMPWVSENNKKITTIKHHKWGEACREREGNKGGGKCGSHNYHNEGYTCMKLSSNNLNGS